MRLVVFLLFLLLATTSTYAATVVEIEDGKQIIVDVSMKDLNLIKTNFPSVDVYTNSKALDVSIDGGNVFVGWKDQDGKTPESIFIVSDTGETYTVTLIPKSIPSEIVMLKDISARYIAPEPKNEAKQTQEEKNTDYVTELKRIIKSMYQGEQLSGYNYVKMSKKIPKWNSIDYTLVGTFLGAKYRGDVYNLTNMTDKTLHIAQNDLYEQGVVAVSIDRQNVLPGESTVIFIVRKNDNS